MIQNRRLDCTLLPQFTTPDVCTVYLEKQNTLIISAYLDILLDVWPDVLDDAILFALEKGYKIVIGADSNAHSELWGCEEANERPGTELAG